MSARLPAHRFVSFQIMPSARFDSGRWRVCCFLSEKWQRKFSVDLVRANVPDNCKPILQVLVTSVL